MACTSCIVNWGMVVLMFAFFAYLIYRRYKEGVALQKKFREGAIAKEVTKDDRVESNTEN